MARFKKAIAALVLGATVVGAAATPADAARWGRGYGYGRGYHDYYHDRGIGTGAAIGLGLLGVGIGAAIASQPRRYAPAPVYDYSYGAPAYYDDYDGYYAPRPYYRSCVTRPMWDPYIGRTVPIQTCN